MSNPVTTTHPHPGQNAATKWQSQRAQECALREAMTFEDPAATAPAKRRLCVTCVAGVGVIVAATVLLGSGLLT